MHRFGYILLLLLVLVSKAYAQQKPPLLAFASDTQEPLWVEKLIREADHNMQATQMIFNEVGLRRASAFFILGDVVSSGKQDKAWKNLDAYMAQVAKDSVPVYATLGNHDIMFNAKKGMAKFKTRFPAYNTTGYMVVIDSVAVILLNSNFSAMSTVEIQMQNNWYQGQLKALDADAAVKLIITGCHHSPYTNSKVVKPSVQVQQYFVAPFLKSNKSVLFLSGHSHNYEQFNIKGKSFVVIGGGGGLHQYVKPNHNFMKDIAADYKPVFHYLEVRRKGNELDVLSRQLTPDYTRLVDGLRFTIK